MSHIFFRRICRRTPLRFLPSPLLSSPKSVRLRRLASTSPKPSGHDSPHDDRTEREELVSDAIEYKKRESKYRQEEKQHLYESKERTVEAMDKKVTSAKDIARFKHLYHNLDPTKEGLKVCDFLNIVRESGMSATEQEIENLFRKFNLEEYGVMNEDEFIDFMTSIKTMSLEKLEVQQHKSKADEEMDNRSWIARKYDGMKAECAHCKRGFHLLFRQLKFASDRTVHVLEGRTLSSFEYGKALRAARDFFVLIPIACFAMAPGGSIIVAGIVKYFPQFLPTTFRIENMSHQRKAEIVVTEVAAVVEDMERKLRKEKLDWVHQDTSFAELKKFLSNQKHMNMSLDTFLCREETNFLDDIHLRTKGIIDRLDSSWLFDLCASCPAFAKYDSNTIKKTPKPILRSMLRRHIKHVAQNNRKLMKLVDPAHIPNIKSMEKDLIDRSFPPTLTKREYDIWTTLEKELAILLAFMFHLRAKHFKLEKPA